MSDNLLTVVGTVVAIAALGVMVAGGVFFWRMAHRIQASTASALQASAEAHGWQFRRHQEIGLIEDHWSGTTDGVAWTSQHRGVGGNQNDDSYARHTHRWRAALVGGPPSALVAVHERSALDGVDDKVKQLPGFMQGLASAAIDHVASEFFGPDAADVDLSSWQVVEGHGIPGVRMLARTADATSRALARQVAPVLQREPAMVDASSTPPAVLMAPDAVHLAWRSQPSAVDMERGVALGVALARALTSR